MRIACKPLVLGVVLILSPAVAGAQEDETAATASAEPAGEISDEELLGGDFGSKVGELIKTVGKRAITRARRAFALGPYVGVAPGLAFDDNKTVDVSLSAGLGLYKYDVPIGPSMAQLKDAIKDRFLAVVKDKIKAFIKTGQKPGKGDIERFVKEAWEEVKNELMLAYRPSHFEKPGFSVALEGLYLFSAKEWDVRVQFGLGVSAIYLAAGLSLHGGNGVALVIPVEISKPLLLTRSVRAPTVHFFARADIAATGRGVVVDDRIFVGARFALDVI